MKIHNETKIKYLIYFYFFCHDSEEMTNENLDKIKLLEINPELPRRIIKPTLLLENKVKRKKSFLALCASEDLDNADNSRLNNFFFGYFLFINKP